MEVSIINCLFLLQKNKQTYKQKNCWRTHTVDVESVVICSSGTWNTLGFYQKEETDITLSATCDTSPHYNPTTKPISHRQFTHIIIPTADRRPSLGVQQTARRAMCVCLTKLWSVKQRLNLCKQALALLPNCRPAAWTGAWRGTNPLAQTWVIHDCVCLSELDWAKDSGRQIKKKTWW